MSNRRSYENKRCRPLKGTWLPGEIVTSPAFMALTGKAPQVLLLLYCKRMIRKMKVSGKPGKRKKEYVTMNALDLRLTYAEARQWGLSEGQFKRARDQLVRVGFVDIIEAGGGMAGNAAKYGESDRWRRYGEPDFVEAERPKDTRQRHNQFGKRKKDSFAAAEPALPPAVRSLEEVSPNHSDDAFSFGDIDAQDKRRRIEEPAASSARRGPLES